MLLVWCGRFSLTFGLAGHLEKWRRQARENPRGVRVVSGGKLDSVSHDSPTNGEHLFYKLLSVLNVDRHKLITCAQSATKASGLTV